MYKVELYSDLKVTSQVMFENKLQAIEWAQLKVDWNNSNTPVNCTYAMIWEDKTMVKYIS